MEQNPTTFFDTMHGHYKVGMGEGGGNHKRNLQTYHKKEQPQLKLARKGMEILYAEREKRHMHGERRSPNAMDTDEGEDRSLEEVGWQIPFASRPVARLVRSQRPTAKVNLYLVDDDDGNEEIRTTGKAVSRPLVQRHASSEGVPPFPLPPFPRLQSKLI